MDAPCILKNVNSKSAILEDFKMIINLIYTFEPL